MPEKPYLQIPIADCGEPLVALPPKDFAFTKPHPYEDLGAPYGNKSPFYVRQGVLSRLVQAQQLLQQLYPGWRIQIFDAYRPIAVQQFMVEYTFGQLLEAKGLTETAIAPSQRQAILEEVYQFWAVPSANPKTPPPHSTGAAVDVTLVNAEDREVDMGSPIDEVSPRSFPDHFARSSDPVEQQYHAHRQLLAQVMLQAGFERHPYEWWHFSYGDQMWVWLRQQKKPDNRAIAIYGGC
ncbi:D-alanyl-D-alanine dipeptidase [Desertifilum sp. FACHB-1129]|uniref:D-alanyl-D-alanine dipeptidase n=2 Tax=Desertifilum tharense IPPAS B-1220 TaxID=1781255 RepID=A0A1E5QJ17_9CYAN|nr:MULTISPECIES: M15 family metallopeptidase [Desertifilum]MDA0209521.1 D-alanyl-D-alanine dipeptidase [Cyanobacteria bacterium FC1]MBD2314055.1 D-alanyl-D-alanine dipeptidase [Desertifilum sp. FACHB-1129]MBD2321021.1 D-alanyl-D-alanine dipeptidase [Desertifilum sp. FACHB-866]MBD2331150.1 D-alanyl-D-alanine dipeptidase [Desertifilum sp. FACHB-868]OEJ74662.1 D-alanyl-D-alanine dipeptidase [Desertifilum tharense IPPAS B-1220]